MQSVSRFPYFAGFPERSTDRCCQPKQLSGLAGHDLLRLGYAMQLARGRYHR